MAPEHRRIRLEVADDVLAGTFYVELGTTGWVPLEIEVAGGLDVELTVEVDADDLAPLVPSRMVRIPVTDQPIRVTVELFALHLTERRRAVTVRAKMDSGPEQMVIFYAEVVSS